MAETKAPWNKQTLDPASESWRKLPWRKFEQHVYRIQTRIFRAQQRGNQRAVHTLQKLLMRVQGSTTVGSATGDAGQPGEENGGSGWSQICPSKAATRHG